MKKRWLSLVLFVNIAFLMVACGKGKATAVAAKIQNIDNTVSAQVITGLYDEVVTLVEEAQTTIEMGIDPAKQNVVGMNLLSNGDFSAGSENWGTYITKAGIAEFTVLDGVGTFDITATGTEDYSVQLYYDEFPLKVGGIYEFSFDMASDMPRIGSARIQLNGGDYKGYVEDTFDITQELQSYTYTFEMFDTDTHPRLCFNLGTPKQMDPYGDHHKVMIDNVEVKLVDASNIIEEEVVDLSVDCNVNQVGFLPDAKKTVTISSANPGSEFDVVDENGKVVYTGTLSEGYDDTLISGETLYYGEFTDFTTPGIYKIVSRDGAESYPFAIADDVYDDLLKDTFRMLYLQRCGMELTTDLAGDFAHPQCHMQEAVVYETGEKKQISGGWHDAGDYGRYVVPGVQTVQDLFMAYEDFPEIWNGADADNMDIPESGNGIPDILDEARYELDWLLQMQDTATGGVYHKVTCLDFPEFVMPQEEIDTLYLAPVSTAATADFAAIMAKSSDVYKEIDAAFASACLDAAQKAWGYLEVTNNVSGYRNPEDILTGEYPDGQDKDERFWAAAELYKVTQEEKYKVHLEETMEKYILQGYGWSEMGSYGLHAYLSMDEAMQNPVYVDKIKQMVAEKADRILGFAQADGYGAAVGTYNWGSNLTICSNARQLLFAEELTGNTAYGDCAKDQLQYILGENALSYCYVTGYGSLYPVNAHHRPCIVTGKVMKGMVIGGPNQNLEDPFAKALLADAPPAKCYLDNNQSFSTNEVTIYWNSPFIYYLSSQM